LRPEDILRLAEARPDKSQPTKVQTTRTVALLGDLLAECRQVLGESKARSIKESFPETEWGPAAISRAGGDACIGVDILRFQNISQFVLEHVALQAAPE